jgi:hypothetical protein
MRGEGTLIILFSVTETGDVKSSAE